jgi:hypothetical protein
MTEPGLLTNEELAEKCKRNAAEEWLHQSGCLFGLLTGLAAAGLIISLKVLAIIAWSWFLICYLAFFAIPFSAIPVYSLFENIARFRCRHLLRELEGRFGCRPLKEYVRAMRRTIAPGEVAMILVGRTLPLCQIWWICVRVVREGQSGTVEARFGPEDNAGMDIDFGTGKNPQDVFTVARRELSPEIAGRLAEMAGDVVGREVRFRSTVKDGFPVSCALVRGDTNRVTTISCNLAGIPPSRAGQPPVRLVEEVFTAGRELIDRPSIYGSTHFFTGDIEIKDV